MSPASTDLTSSAAAAVPVVNQSLAEQIAGILTTSILLNNWTFFYNNEEVPADQVANPRCLLPAILWQAEKLHRASMLGSSFGIQFQPDQGAFIGAVPVLKPDPNRPRGPLPLFCLETLYQVQENFPMPNDPGAMLDPLVQAFFADDANRLLPWVDLVAEPARVGAGGDVR